MIKKFFLLSALVIANQSVAGTVKKIVDANGNVTFTNMSPQNRGHIVKTYDERQLVTRISISGGGSDRPSLAGRIIKTGAHGYKFRPSYDSPFIMGSFSDRYYGGSARHFEKNKFSGLIAAAANRHGVSEKLVHAVIQTESAYNAHAVSHAGAVGLMQLMPDTARRFGVTNRTDPAQNVNGGTRYLRELLEMFNYNLRLAVAAYNAGENAVIKYNNSIPPYPETQNYVRQVLALYNQAF